MTNVSGNELDSLLFMNQGRISEEKSRSNDISSEYSQKCRNFVYHFDKRMYRVIQPLKVFTKWNSVNVFFLRMAV